MAEAVAICDGGRIYSHRRQTPSMEVSGNREGVVRWVLGFNGFDTDGLRSEGFDFIGFDGDGLEARLAFTTSGQRNHQLGKWRKGAAERSSFLTLVTVVRR